MPPSEAKRQALLTACAFAKVFMDSADAELRGAPAKPRQEAARQLTFALAALWHGEYQTYNPDIHRSSILPYPEESHDDLDV